MQESSGQASGGVSEIFGDAPWIHEDQMRSWALILGSISLLGVVGLVATSDGTLDIGGRPLGTDFVCFWTAARLALQEGAAAVYDSDVHAAMQNRVFGVPVDYVAFFYPPIFIAALLPLGWLTYTAALGVWLTLTGAAWVATIRHYLHDSAPTWGILVFPAVLVNTGHGQTGFLTGALLGGGMALVERSPLLGGALLGALAYKPHLLVVAPLYLLLTRQLRALGALVGTAAALAALSVAVLGEAPWRAFFSMSRLAVATLESGHLGYQKMVSVFAAARLLGADVGLAYGAHALVSLAALATLFTVGRRLRGPLGAALVATLALFPSPYALDYDLCLAGIPVAILLTEGLRGGFLRYEKLILLVSFVMPMLARPVATSTGVGLAPIVLGALLWAIVRRGLAADAAPRSGA